MDREYQLSKFTELRFEYYSAGRTLWFNDNMETAAILLGSAAELSLKQILVASGNDKESRLMSTHNVLALYQKANEVVLKGGVPVTDDLLHFVTDRLHHRYPRQVEEAAAGAQKRGHAICLALYVIAAYDDLIIGLDEWLRQNYPKENVCLGVMAAHFINRVTGRAVFHCNSAALGCSGTYREILDAEYANAEKEMQAKGLTPETIQYNLNNHRSRLAVWKNAPTGLWVAGNLTTVFGSAFIETPEAMRASHFEYPGRYVGSGHG